MNLRPGDVIITPKNIFLKIIEHYLVYLGINQFGQEVYIENDYRNGVQCITDEHFCFKNPAFKGIRRFTGDETQRYWACERAKSLLSAKYDLARFNFENFANYVQYGKSFSIQVNAANSTFITWAILNIATTVQKSFNQSL